ncbi:protein-glutamate O-methyltransferase [Drosophila serrata]|uniref:protein-glutamate O-methyltransferase n=1 Tax=Drosophila serrata TaxID=7274 RepID=UPI000A1D2A3E|nr:protein-glutamate O-methyltransferase [Drosophila serrata]
MISEADSRTADDLAADIEKKKENEFNEKNLIIYSAPGVQEELSARFLHSIAYVTLRQRSPGLIRDIIAFLRDREPDIVKQCGEYAHFDLKRTVWSLELLREDMVENKEFEIFRVKAPDTERWNKFLNAIGDDKKQWFSSVWLHADCYMYRRIWSIFQRSDTLVGYDYFGEQKMLATKKAVKLMKSILGSTKDLKRSKENFQRLLKLSLWGTRNAYVSTARLNDMLAEYEADLLVDQSAAVWRDLRRAYDPVYVDIVTDNAGFELFTDLVLGDYIIRSRLAQRVRFHLKAIPWFIMDATHEDFHWLLDFLREQNHPELQNFVNDVQQHLLDRSFILCEKSYFWTSGYDFSHMKEVQPCLYVYLSEASLVIFKGDLNYRKLLGDINYSSTDSFSDCLRGFQPTSVCALRTIKTDLYCGLAVCQLEWLNEDEPDWMEKGEKGVIQIAVKHRLSGDIIVEI